MVVEGFRISTPPVRKSASERGTRRYDAQMRIKYRMLVLLPSVILTIFVVGICSTILRNYFIAFAWHIRHGNHTVIRGNRVPVPLLWWRVDYFGGNIGLMRAAPRSAFLNGRSLMWYENDGTIEWRPIADSRRVFTDQEAIRATQEDMAHPTFSEPKYAETVKLVTLRRNGPTLYCVSEETHDFIDFSTLDCRSAGTPVILYYSGSSQFEKSAEQILSTME